MIQVILAVMISAAAFYFGTGLGEFWPLAWIAPLPVLAVAFRASGGVAMSAAYLAYFLGGLNEFSYLRMVTPPLVLLQALIIPPLIFAFCVVAARYAVGRLPVSAAVFAFPACWVTWEFLFSLFSPHGTFNSIAYSQTDFLLVLQIASVTGICGITFLLMLIPSAIAVAWTRRSVSALVPAIVISTAVLTYGALRLHRPLQKPRIHVGLAATDRGIGAAWRTKDPSVALAVSHEYADRVARLAAQGAQVVVLPEKFVGVTPEDSDRVLQIFSDAARSARITVIAGLNRVAIDPLRNVAAVFAPDGHLITEYDKRHMLPGPETGYRIGFVPALFPTPSGRWGVAICKDMDFPAWSRRYGESGASILAVPAWDFVRDGRLHCRMAVARGVENGFAMARVAQQGLLTFVDAYGRILAEESSASSSEVLLVRDLNPGPGATFYTRFGDWFGWTSVALFVALFAAAALRPRLS
jgi:apolipoprotein N-acyltransferase